MTGIHGTDRPVPAAGRSGDFPEAHWLLPPAEVRFAGNGVHVWRGNLDLGDKQLARLHRCLSPDECLRAGRYFFDVDRKRFVAARGMLRSILSKYCGVAPDRVRFHYGPYGKPALSPDASADLPRFNLSHSHGVCLLALGRNRRLGVDLELRRPDSRLAQDMLQAFSPKEVSALRLLPPTEFVDALFRGWTHKEAYLKAIGQGLRISPERVEVLVGQEKVKPRMRLDGNSIEPSGWTFEELRPGPNYIGALAVEGYGHKTEFLQWQPDPSAANGAQKHTSS